MEISIFDYIIIISYFLILFIIGFYVKRKVNALDDYFLAGRRLTLPIFVATLVSTWYGGLLGVGELSFNYGIVNWLTQGFFWYLVYLFFCQPQHFPTLKFRPAQFAPHHGDRERYL